MSRIDSWREEQRSAYLYGVVAECEQGTTRAALFRELAGMAREQAAIWAREMAKRGETVPADYRPDLRTRLVERLLRRFGPHAMRPVLTAMKLRGMSLYQRAGLPGHAMPLNREQIGRRHRRGDAAGNLRAAVFGVNDGLVSNASLIMGVAGANAGSDVILLTGVAGLVAGAMSMAAGEYISVRSQREMYEYQIGLERDELAQYPDEEAAELALIYEAKGVPRDDARAMSRALIADPEKALDTLTREELGLNPDELGSPWGAAIASFVSFASGAALPLAPFVFGAGPVALATAIALTLTGLFAVGASLSLFTGRGALLSGLRMTAIGGLAGALTFAIGRLVGVSV